MQFTAPLWDADGNHVVGSPDYIDECYVDYYMPYKCLISTCEHSVSSFRVIKL